MGVVVLAALAAGADFAAARSEAQNSLSPQVSLLEVPEPDLTAADPQVREQIRGARAAFTAALAQPGASRAQRAEAFGNLGQIYQAYGFNNAALNCYANASRLDPQSFRWSYYAGYLRQESGDTETAEVDLKHALTLQPDNTPALLRLGDLELALDRPDAARDYFTRAASQKIGSPSALVGLGKVALLQRQYDAALKDFTEALAREPQASSIHYQLAMAYRGLGDLPHMQEQLQARGNVEPALHDPLLDEIDALKQGKVGLLERGNTALRENRFADAVAAFRQMAQLSPSDPLGYKYMAIALAGAGNFGEALDADAHSLELDPNNAGVHFNMGILLIQAAKEDQAIGHFQQALRLDPGLVAAHFQLANLLMRRRQDADAEREYAIVVSLEPQNVFARLMEAMSAVHAGAYARARRLLEDATAAFPSDADSANALARLLAAAPDAAVRDPDRALRIVQALVKNRQGDPLEVGITLAMALASVGRFQEAAGYQAAIIQQLEASQQGGLARPLRQDLERYQQHKACRTPWAADDPIFTPDPSSSPLPPEAKTMTANP